MTTFKAKARAVELLGKGQIADLPTAITELWKNGYDAYAQNLVCKLFLESYKDNNSPIFQLSDNGFGMSSIDITEKWLVLGTDSKARGERVTAKFGLEERIPMGEKGIGRLSVSYLGYQMLMLTKQQDKAANALFFDWRILDNYNFYLEDLFIPLFSFNSPESFKNGFHQAKKSFLANLRDNSSDKDDLWKDQSELKESIQEGVRNILLPQFINDEVISNFCKKDYHGTTFLIFNPHEQLLELSDKDRIEFKEDSSVNYIRASLSGMHNDLEHPSKDFETHFYIYDNNGRYDLIDEFFTQKEMRSADHWCKGSFDEQGFFSGELRVFDQREKYTFRPNRPPGETAYGPFSIEWGFMEGAQRNSILNEEQFRNINEKLGTLGGLYVYRDDFRVLPYGRPESDFLEFEERRSRGAGYYFFSHRRFIGYIDISRNRNPNLKDKAGREGFIRNKAYREFKDDLTEFFLDIAKRYLRSTGNDEKDNLREQQIKEINAKYERQAKAVKKKNRRTRKSFIESLEANKDSIKELQEAIQRLRTNLEDEAQKMVINYNNYNSFIREIEEKKTNLRNLKLTKPQGVSLTNKQKKEYSEYQQEYSQVQNELQQCIRVVEDTRTRINKENLKLEYTEKFRNHIQNLEKQFSSFRTIHKDSFNRLNDSLNEEESIQIQSFVEQSETTKLSEDDSKEKITVKINALERLIEDQNKTIDDTVGGFINHVSNLQIDVDDDFLRGWYQEQNETLEKRLGDYEELAQLGMAIEIIDHQFNVLYSQMNDAISEFDKLSRKDRKLESPFRQLKGAFQHLEGNYKLLKPLYRTSRRSREVITGLEIERYIRQFYANEFSRYRIEFSVDEGFKKYEFFTYDSILKPMFINLISNANYWLIPAKERKIRIECEDKKILVMNSGEKIEDGYLEDIFTLFFTRKRDGRGIGLYLVKKNLQSIGYNIFATNDKQYNKLGGACFVIVRDNE